MTKTKKIISKLIQTKLGKTIFNVAITPPILVMVASIAIFVFIAERKV